MVGSARPPGSDPPSRRACDLHISTHKPTLTRPKYAADYNRNRTNLRIWRSSDLRNTILLVVQINGMGLLLHFEKQRNESWKKSFSCVGKK